jgi:ureidoglycolate dehydrogenase (NAD+)
MTDSDTVRVAPEDLQTFASDLLEAVGVTSPHHESVAEALVRADLRGVDSHGVARLEPYVRHFEAGGFNPDPDVQTQRRNECAIATDADNGPGQVAAKMTMERLISLARESGVAVGTVKNSNHFGTAAYYTEMAAAADCVGIAMTNVPDEVVPFGGTEPYLGTNPIAVSVPMSDEEFVTMDMATSIVAMGKIDHVAAEKGEEIPAGWAVDDEGEPTTDPTRVRALKPMGGAKGYCLAVIVDMLAGLLSEAGQSTETGPLYDDYDEGMGLGHFFLAIDVATMRDIDAFERAVEVFVEGLKRVDTKDGVDEVLYPGEIENRNARENRERGVPINRNVYGKLEEIADRYDVSIPDPKQ